MLTHADVWVHRGDEGGGHPAHGRGARGLCWRFRSKSEGRVDVRQHVARRYAREPTGAYADTYAYVCRRMLTNAGYHVARRYARGLTVAGTT